MAVVTVAADNTTVGGDYGWYAIHCNVYGAKIYLDDKYIGTTPQSGSLTFPVSTTGKPYMTIRVQKNGYSAFVDSITRFPGKGETVDLYTVLNKYPETMETMIGGDRGWYAVHCNIDGAVVYFDDSYCGEISRGLLYVSIYTAGPPYHEYTVKKDGYTNFTGTITEVPGKGETVDLYATLNRLTSITPAPEQIGGSVGWFVVHSNVDDAMVLFDNDARGLIKNGNLTVQVYVTGTPYKTFTVTKNGYLPYTGTIDKYPAKGGTVDLYATLHAGSAVPASPGATPAQKSPGASWICGLALLIAGAATAAFSRK